MKNIVRLFAATLIAVVCSLSVSAQDASHQRMSREKLAEKQAQNIASEMAFDSKTTARFVETYCRCQKEIWALGPRPGHGKNAGRQNMNDDQTDEAIKQRFAQSQKILDIRQKYYAEYSKFLTPRQIERVYQLERKMMERLAKHKGNAQKRVRR